MLTLAEKLAKEIAAQQNELDRIRKVVQVELPVAQARLDALVAVAAKVALQPAFEKQVQALAALGIRLDD